MILPLKIRDLTFRYAGSEKEILSGLNLEIGAGEITGITGSSGSGKSTLCFCMMGIIPHIYQGVIKGKVTIFGNPVSGMKVSRIATKAGIVFQDPDTQLFSPTVEDDIAFGPENLCLDRETISYRIKNSLKMVGMSGHRFSDSRNLSGGEKQLVAVASVLSLNPRIIIFDEVMSQLDIKSKTGLKSVMLDLKKNGRSIVIVEHDSENLDIADRIYTLSDGILL